MLFAVLLTSQLRSRGFLRSVVFFPVLVSTVAVGITFSVLLQPDTGVVAHRALSTVGYHRPGLARQTAHRAVRRWPWSTSGRASGWPP